MTVNKYVVRAVFVLGLLVLAALVYGVIRALSSSPPVADPTVTVTATTTVTATATVTPAPPALTAGQPCVTSRLRSAVVPDIAPAGTGDTDTFDVVLTNTGSVSCTISGYPTVEAVGYGDGTQLGLPAAKTGSPQPTGTAATLNPGEAQAVELDVDDSKVYGSNTGCSDHYADGLRIYPPGQSTALYSPTSDITACTTTSYSILSVGAFGNE